MQIRSLFTGRWKHSSLSFMPQMKAEGNLLSLHNKGKRHKRSFPKNLPSVLVVTESILEGLVLSEVTTHIHTEATFPAFISLRGK